MKWISSVLVLMFVMTHSYADERPAAPSAKPQPRPVPIRSGAVLLGAVNTSIGFVGIHEGPKPDPRKGGFAKFTGKAEVLEDGTLQSVALDIETASLWTPIPQLTAHLKSPDFFDVREHPKASFRTTAIKPSAKPGWFDVTGRLTLLGTAKEIQIPVAVTVTPKGLTLASEFEIDRTQFGMTYGEGKVKKNVNLSVVIGEPTTTPDAN